MLQIFLFFKKYCAILYIIYTLYICKKIQPKQNNIKGEKKMARVLISMPEQFLTQIDNVAQGENRTRSELIREALRTYINRSKLRENTFANKNAAILEALLD